MSDTNDRSIQLEQRKDEEKQNQLVEQGDQSSQISVRKQKAKKIFSCYACRKRKLKCDRMDPCGACSGRGESHLCTWQEGQRPEKSQNENIYQLTNLVMNLVDEMRELRNMNSKLMENVGKDNKERRKRKTSEESIDSEADYISDSSKRKSLAPTNIFDLLPERPLLANLMVEFIRRCLPLCVFINLEDILSTLEKVENIRSGIEKKDGNKIGFPIILLQMKCSLLLACCSFILLNLDAATADRLYLEEDKIESMANAMWYRSKELVNQSSLDIIELPEEVSGIRSSEARTRVGDKIISHDILAAEAGLADPSQARNLLLLRIVSIKLVLLNAAKSFVTPDEFLKFHLDTIASAVDASLDTPLSDQFMPLEFESLRVRLLSSLRLLDWTAQGTYHHGGYYLLSESQTFPISGSNVSINVDEMQIDSTKFDSVYRFERFKQAKHYLRHALCLAQLSRRVKHCVEREGLVPPAEAAALCEEIDKVETQFSFYQMVSHTNAFDDKFEEKLIKLIKFASTYGKKEDPSLFGGHSIGGQNSLRIQSAYLSLELSLIRFKLFRHEFFNVLRRPISYERLQIVCLDACMDACIMVLSHCRSICQDQNLNIERNSDLQSRRNVPNTLRRVLQPASSAALVGQVILLTARSPQDISKEESTVRGVEENATISLLVRPTKVGNNNDTQGSFTLEKIKILKWHVDAVLKELQILQETSKLAQTRYKLHIRCM